MDLEGNMCPRRLPLGTLLLQLSGHIMPGWGKVQPQDYSPSQVTKQVLLERLDLYYDVALPEVPVP